jgi:hypothetical protein
LEDRTLPSAAVWTDHPDYAPGATTVINGSGYGPNETVNLSVVLASGAQGPAWSVTGDASGNFSTSVDVPGDGSWATTSANPMTLTAAGQTSGLSAQTTFTDANNPVVRNYSVAISPSSTTYGATQSYTFTVTNLASSSSSQNLGSITIGVPNSFTVSGLTSVTWTDGAGPHTDANGIPPGQHHVPPGGQLGGDG